MHSLRSLCLFLAATNLVGCAAGPHTGHTKALQPSYDLLVAYQGDERIKALACGDLDLSAPGDEIVAVDRGGHVHLLTLVDGAFVDEQIASTGGELLQVAVGDLAPDIPGDEIVVVGLESGDINAPHANEVPGVVRVFYREGGGWAETTLRTKATVRTVGVAPFGSGAARRDYLYAGGDFGRVIRASLNPSSDSSSGGRALDVETWMEHEINLSGLELVQEEGEEIGGIAIESSFLGMTFRDGSVRWMIVTPEGLIATTLHHKFPAPLTQLMYNKTTGGLVADEGGSLHYVTSPGNDPMSGNMAGYELVFRAKNRGLRGLVLLDIDPTTPGVEACTASQDGIIRVVDLQEKSHSHGAILQVASDSGPLRTLTSGTFEGFGEALVSGGDSGSVFMVYRR